MANQDVRKSLPLIADVSKITEYAVWKAEPLAGFATSRRGQKILVFGDQLDDHEYRFTCIEQSNKPFASFSFTETIHLINY